MRHPALISTVFVLGAVAVGCGGGGGHGGFGGSGGNTGNPAIDATLSPLFTSMRSGTSNLDPSVTNGSINNPLEQSSKSSTNTFNLGGSANDGTVTSVTVTVTVTPKNDGSSTSTVTVVEPGTNFQFLSVTQTINAPNLSVRVPQGGLSALAANGNGHAFIVVRATYTSTLTRTFNNTSTSGKTLVNTAGLTPPPVAGTSTSNGSGYEDFLVDYLITGSGLSAKVNAIATGSGQSTSTRNGGPSTSPLNQNYSTVTIGGMSFPANSDAIVAVGSDSGVTPSVTSNATFVTNFSLSGGIQGVTPSTDLKDNVTPEVNNDASTTITYGGALSTPPNVGDGIVQIDRAVNIETVEVEDPASGPVLSSLNSGNALGFAGNMKQVLYLPNAAAVHRAIYLLR